MLYKGDESGSIIVSLADKSLLLDSSSDTYVKSNDGGNDMETDGDSARLEISEYFNQEQKQYHVIY